MAHFGLSATRCHSYDMTNARVATAVFSFRCACRTFELLPRRSARAKAGELFCKDCKETLVFTGEVIPVPARPLAG